MFESFFRKSFQGKFQVSLKSDKSKRYFTRRPIHISYIPFSSSVVKSTMLPHRNIHKYTWTSPDEKTHNQIDHVLVDRRWHSSVLYVRSFRGADCDIDHYLVIAKNRERLAVGKQAAQRFDRQRFN